MGDSRDISSSSLADLPADELAIYARELGLDIGTQTPRGGLLRLVRERQALLLELDREAMLQVVVWARMPVRKSANKEVLAKHIASISTQRFAGLSDRGLRVLAQLRGLEADRFDPRPLIEKRLRRQEGLWARVRRGRRSVVGSLISNLVESSETDGDYRFLPEENNTRSLRATIEDEGVVGGIARKLRGVADQYVYEKLDEIERRIDEKLDEIDRRLGEWRNQEVANRLRLVKITLIATIIVAIVSLGYHYLKTGVDKVAGQPTDIAKVVETSEVDQSGLTFCVASRGHGNAHAVGPARIPRCSRVLGIHGNATRKRTSL